MKNIKNNHISPNEKNNQFCRGRLWPLFFASSDDWWWLVKWILGYCYTVYSFFLLRLTSRFYFFLKKCIISILLLTSSLKGAFCLHFVLLLDFTSFLKGVFSLYWICYLTLLSCEKVSPVYTFFGFYSFPAEILCLRNPAAIEIKKYCGIFPSFRYFLFNGNEYRRRS